MVSPNWEQLEAMLAQMSYDQREQLISRALRLQHRDAGDVAEASASDRQHAAWNRLWGHAGTQTADAEPDHGTVVSRDYRRLLYGLSDDAGPDRPMPSGEDVS